MANAAVRMQRTASLSASVGAISAPGSAMKRIKIVDFDAGYEGTAADVAARLDLQRSSAAGTSTSVTPQLRDLADGALVSVAGQNHTIEPTYTANAFQRSPAFNQRSWIRWVAAPGDEIVIPATANAGLGFATPVGPTVAITVNVSMIEC